MTHFYILYFLSFVQHCNLKGMLETLGMEFEGRPHCGLDDARNIARILLVLIEENAPLHINERLLLKHYRSREKALLASATAIVQKRTDGMGELVSSCAYAHRRHLQVILFLLYLQAPCFHSINSRWRDFRRHHLLVQQTERSPVGE